MWQDSEVDLANSAVLVAVFKTCRQKEQKEEKAISFSSIQNSSLAKVISLFTNKKEDMYTNVNT